MASIEAFVSESIFELLAYPSPTVCSGFGLAVMPSMTNCWANKKDESGKGARLELFTQDHARAEKAADTTHQIQR